MSGRSREVELASARFAAKYGRPPRRVELRNLKLENRRSKQLHTTSDLREEWARLGAEHRLDADGA